jgi:hypothetical protein
MAADDFKLNSQEYFERPGINVMYGQDYYPEGHQGGLSILMHDERVASNGDVRLEPSPGQWSPIPKPGKREINAATQEIRVPLAFPNPELDRKGFNPIIYPDLELNYTVRARPEGDSIRVSVDFDQPIPKDWVGKVGFNLELFPGLMFGKSYQLGNTEGVFQQQPSGPGELPVLARGKRLDVGAETELYHLTIETIKGGELELLDGRGNHNNGWFVVRALAPANATAGAIEWRVTPHAKAGWMRQPVLQVSQVGYHPAQPKQVVIEYDARDTKRENVKLQRIGSVGQVKTVIDRKPEEWGRFLRYQYARLDFSEVKEPGLYVIRYGTQVSHPFRIDANVFAREVWQPTLEYFLPAQMCHMKVMEKYRMWHGLCHLDDARMAPVDHNHFDGYLQGPSTLTSYKPGDHVPGINVGGWHDAGDWDLRVESQADTMYGLALAWELFHVDYDNTTIDQKNLVTEIHEPDGKPDVLQQLEHGALSVVGGYESLGRLYRGIIEPTLRQYVFLGDGANMTDNVVFDPKKPGTPPPVGLPGSADDRWVFTEENPRRELLTAAGLAATARALKGYNDDLAARSLKAAIAIYDRAQPKEELARVGAAVELLIATGDKKYRDLLVSQRDAIAANIERVGWMVGSHAAAGQGRRIHEDHPRCGGRVSRQRRCTREGNPIRRTLQARHLGCGLEHPAVRLGPVDAAPVVPGSVPAHLCVAGAELHSRRAPGVEHRVIRVRRRREVADHRLRVQSRRLVAHPGWQRLGHGAHPAGLPRAQALAFLLAADRVRARPRYHGLSTAGAGRGPRSEPIKRRRHYCRRLFVPAAQRSLITSPHCIWTS